MALGGLAGARGAGCPRLVGGAARLQLEDAARATDAASALLAPAPAGTSRARRRSRSGVARGGSGPSPEALRRALQRLDAERHPRAVRCSSSRSAPAAAAAGEPHRLPSRGTLRSRRCRPTGATCSARSSSTRPTTSSRGALHLAPINPRRIGSTLRCSSGARAVRLRRVGRDGAPLPRALRRRRDPRRVEVLRVSRTPPGRHAGAGLADRRPDGLTTAAARPQPRAARRRSARRARRRSRPAAAPRPPRRACGRPPGRRPRTRPTCGRGRPGRRGRRRRRGSRAARRRPLRAPRRRGRRPGRPRRRRRRCPAGRPGR